LWSGRAGGAPGDGRPASTDDRHTTQEPTRAPSPRRRRRPMATREARASAPATVIVVPRDGSGDVRTLPHRSRGVVLELMPLPRTPSALSWPAIGAALMGVAAFCLVASAVYVMNDYMDREADRLHPEKRFRPLASGTVPVPVALGLLALLVGGGFTIAVSL